MRSKTIIEERATFKRAMAYMSVYLLIGGIFGYVAAIRASGIQQGFLVLSILGLWIYSLTTVVNIKSKRLCYLEVLNNKVLFHALAFDKSRVYGPYDFVKVEVQIPQISKNSEEALTSEFQLKLNGNRFYMTQEQIAWVLLYLDETRLRCDGLSDAARALEYRLHNNLEEYRGKLSLICN